MAREIERKFLVADPSILHGRTGMNIVQGYLAKQGMTVRVRIIDDEGFLTLKGPSQGCSRDEFEYPIPLVDALTLLECYCNGQHVQKTRYLVPHGRHVFEVDVFRGGHAGLIVAEVELGHEDEVVELPNWLAREVTGDPNYGNYALAQAETCASDCLAAAKLQALV